MTSRDRTTVFKRYRAEARLALGEPNAHGVFGSAGNQNAVLTTDGLKNFREAAELPPQWTISPPYGWVSEELESLRKRLLLPEFADKSEEEHAVDQKTAEIARLFQSVEAKVRQLSEHVHEVSLSRPERRIRENIQRKHAMEVQELSVRFRREQRRYLERLRKVEAENASALDMDDAGRSWAVGSANDSRDHQLEQENAFDPGFNAKQLALWRHAETHAGARYEEARRIARSIEELSGIMRDLATLVIEQGTVIDRIDYNIEQSDIQAERALRQLQQARRTQKRGWIHYCTLVLALGCVVLFLILVMKWVYLY
ncbi:Syntaxin 16 [Cyanidiococcus yangmingshanensis]|uniref:Syntaxin 16 n=1 Tax=Cyanidiococcus yangmingshanensis TaxID=2690220 RepID=A0A7J7IFV5_9RHOD|nr:Syntaxin 16 [Cyanidiococcus yangmingshanensis]